MFPDADTTAGALPASLSLRSLDTACKRRRDPYPMSTSKSSSNVAVDRDLVIVGGGPAGLTAAYQWSKAGGHSAVFEASDQVGGIARTEQYKGYRFDIGGHRFFTKVKPVEKLWHEILTHEFIKVPRLSRIFYRGKYYDYPLSAFNALKNLGPYEAVRILLSYAKWKVKPSRVEENLEQWVSNRFGGRLFWHFFRTYTEKVWGIPCTEIRADWAAQRIKNLSLRKAVWNAVSGRNDTTSLISKFDYPKLGPGQMWEKCRDIVTEAGSTVHMESPVTEVHREGKRITGVTHRSADGSTHHRPLEELITSMPITQLVQQMVPPAPDAVREASGKLCYRDFLIVALIVNEADPFPDNWIYIHAPEVKVGRIQNFRSWSEHMVPDPDTASLGLEYFCHKGDGLWNSDDAELIALAEKELIQLGLARPGMVVDGTVVRQEKAYPVYDADYRANLQVVTDYLDGFENLHTVGRNGMHRYNNQDHSMLSAMLAVENLLGAKHDLWNVNVERSYHEDFVTRKQGADVEADAGRDSDAAVSDGIRISGDDAASGIPDAGGRSHPDPVAVVTDAVAASSPIHGEAPNTSCGSGGRPDGGRQQVQPA